MVRLPTRHLRGERGAGQRSVTVIGGQRWASRHVPPTPRCSSTGRAPKRRLYGVIASPHGSSSTTRYPGDSSAGRTHAAAALAPLLKASAQKSSAPERSSASQASKAATSRAYASSDSDGNSSARSYVGRTRKASASTSSVNPRFLATTSFAKPFAITTTSTSSPAALSAAIAAGARAVDGSNRRTETVVVVRAAIGHLVHEQSRPTGKRETRRLR